MKVLSCFTLLSFTATVGTSVMPPLSDGRTDWPEAAPGIVGFAIATVVLAAFHHKARRRRGISLPRAISGLPLIISGVGLVGFGVVFLVGGDDLSRTLSMLTAVVGAVVTAAGIVSLILNRKPAHGRGFPVVQHS